MMLATASKLAAIAVALAVQGVLAVPAPDVVAVADPRPQPTGEVIPSEAYLINGTEIVPLVGRQTGANGPGVRLMNCNPVRGLCRLLLETFQPQHTLLPAFHRRNYLLQKLKFDPNVPSLSALL